MVQHDTRIYSVSQQQQRKVASWAVSTESSFSSLCSCQTVCSYHIQFWALQCRNYSNKFKQVQRVTGVHVLRRDIDGRGHVWLGKYEGIGRDLIVALQYYQAPGYYQEDKANFFMVVQNRKRRNSSHTLKQIVLAGYKGKRVTMKIIKQSSWGPEMLCKLHLWRLSKTQLDKVLIFLSWPTLSRGLGEKPQRSFSARMILGISSLFALQLRVYKAT